MTKAVGCDGREPEASKHTAGCSRQLQHRLSMVQPQWSSRLSAVQPGVLTPKHLEARSQASKPLTCTVLLPHTHSSCQAQAWGQAIL